MIKKFLIALNFLTIIPFKLKNISTEKFVESIYYFPFIGLIIGLILEIGFFLFSFCFPLFIVILLVLILEIFITGGFHLDGLADFTDGFMAGKNKQEILKIMKEPQIGVFGTLSLIIILSLKYCLLLNLQKHLFSILIMMPFLARWSIVYFSFISFPAQEQGLGKLATQYKSKIGFILNFIFILIINWYFFKYFSLIILLFLILIITLIKFIVHRKIGGITGDVLGASVEIIEISYLILLSIFLH
ncbi:MAG: adenosylcobinamide-GDP ribazoletransferase [bacterium]